MLVCATTPVMKPVTVTVDGIVMVRYVVPPVVVWFTKYVVVGELVIEVVVGPVTVVCE